MKRKSSTNYQFIILSWHLTGRRYFNFISETNLKL